MRTYHVCSPVEIDGVLRLAGALVEVDRLDPAIERLIGPYLQPPPPPPPPPRSPPGLYYVAISAGVARGVNIIGHGVVLRLAAGEADQFSHAVSPLDLDEILAVARTQKETL